MTSYNLIEAYNIDLSVDPSMENYLSQAAIADIAYSKALESFDPMVESERAYIDTAAMEAEAASESWFDRIKTAVSKFVAAVGNVLSNITRSIKLFFTKGEAKKVEADAAVLAEKERKENAKAFISAAGEMAYDAAKVAVPKITWGYIKDRPHGVYQTVMSVVSNATKGTALNDVSKATRAAFTVDKTKERASNVVKGAKGLVRKARRFFTGSNDNEQSSSNSKNESEMKTISAKELQEAARIAGSEASDLEKASKATANTLKNMNQTTDPNLRSKIRADVTGVFNEAIDVIRDRLNSIRMAVSKLTKTGNSDKEST